MNQLPSSDERKLLAGLAALYPIDGLLHVGSWLETQVQLYLDLGVANLTLADSDDARIEKFNARQDLPETARIKQVVLSKDGRKSTYYKASLQAESGLVKPEVLRPIWQNITTTDELSVQTKTLDAFVSAHEISPNWLIMNTVMAGPILEGGDLCLQGVDVLIARTVLEADENSEIHAFCKDALDACMTARGFVACAHLSTRHPALSQIIYVRDWKSALRQDLAHKQDEIDKLQLENEEFASSLAHEVARNKDKMQTVKDAESKRALSDNNLQNLRNRHKLLAKSYKDQAGIMGKIKAQLLAAQKALTDNAISDELHNSKDKKPSDRDEE